MNKIGAMVRYELVMAWRRRSLPILWLVLVLTSLAFSLLAASLTHSNTIRIIDPATRAAAAASGWSIEAFMLTQQQASYLALTVFVFNLALVLIGADAIPLDRQFKIRELLDALPISRAQYLGGKVLGAWGSVILILLTGGAVSTLAQYLILGAFDGRLIALLWLVLALPLSLANSTVSVLAASFWGSRRVAVLVNLLLLPLFLLMIWVGVMDLLYAQGWVDPAYLRSTVMLQPGESLAAAIQTHTSAALALLAGVSLAAWISVWAGLRYQTAR